MEIERLLERFYEGETTLEEEKLLRDFFRGNDVPGHLQEHRALFGYYAEEKEVALASGDFDAKLNDRLKAAGEEPAVSYLHPHRRRMMFLSGIAAGILLLAGLLFTFRTEVFNGLSAHRQAEAELTLATTREALMVVSDNLNHGLRQMERLKTLDKAMKELETFNKFYQYQLIIINPDKMTNQSIKSK